MDLFKNLGEKAKNTARAVGERSSDLVETGKLKMEVSQLEGDIRRLKTDIGNLFYNAYINMGDDSQNEEIITLCEEIKSKYEAIEDLKYKADNI